MKAILRGTRIAPKKASLVAGMVRGRKVTDALTLLKFLPKKGAKTIYKVIRSAASNAQHNFHQKIEDLIVSKIVVTQGATLKRSLPISRGRTHPLLKKTSHIWVEVSSSVAPAPSSTTEIPSEEKSAKEVVKEPKVAKKPAKISVKRLKAVEKKEPKKEQQ
ncbi:50S ribosomal protein L22 [Candidatus Peregrinibacteria bacterium]|nr:50S ribosomal protein L22 [Candidatus Peregrinibacteria bacterium]